MTFDEAKNLIEDKDQKYDEDARNLKFDLAGAEHDILYVTEFIEEMEEEEILMLDRMGFHLDEDFNGWAIFV